MASLRVLDLAGRGVVYCATCTSVTNTCTLSLFLSGTSIMESESVVSGTLRVSEELD